jgi:hypothetical protein
MAHFADSTKVDWKSVYREMAREARARADSIGHSDLKQTWKDMAEGWDHLAQLVPEECFCGRSAIGSKYYVGEERVPYCGSHLIEAITNDTLNRTRIKPFD